MKIRLQFALLTRLLILGVLASAAHAATVYTQDWEGSVYDFYADPGSSANTSSAVVHSGAQSAEFTLDDAHFAYTRWKSEDISGLGLTVANLTADLWVYRDFGRSDLAPYLLFTIVTPDAQETLAIQFLMPLIPDDTWSLNSVNRTTTTFHVVGDRTGLGATEFSSSGTQGTLDDLASRTYSGATLWGDFTISHVRVGVGMWDESKEYHAFADDLSLYGPAAIPEPAAISLVTGFLALLTAGVSVRRRNARAQ